MASTSLKRTIGTATSTTKGTFSYWIKRATLTDDRMITSWGSVNSQFLITWQDQAIMFGDFDGSYNLQYKTNRLFRDTSAWYHIVVAIDTTLATSTDRVKLYVNGVQETSFSTSTAPSQNLVLNFSNNGEEFRIGERDSGEYLNGSMTHIHFTDGTAYNASTFGEFDAQNVWKPKTQPSVTYGNNGFFLKFANAGSLGTDSSGNGNDFTMSGTGTQTLDTPSNVFATMNPLNKGANVTLSNGNLTCVGSGTYVSVSSTLAVNTGKWYWEAKCNTASPNNRLNVGILKTTANMANTQWIGSVIESYGYLNDGTIYNNGSQLLDTGTTVSVGDIVGFLLDLDNGTLKLKKNGSDVYSGNAVVSSLNTGDYWYVAQGADVSNVDFNFGNGYFGTTAVSSATSDESGLGIFEYTVPSGYYALCTKNINTQEYD